MTSPRFVRLVSMLRPDKNIPSGPYGGLVTTVLLIVVAATLMVDFSQNPVLLDGTQQWLIFSAMALSYDYFSGYTGYYNLGYGAFVAVGAYTFVLTSNAGVTLLVALILSGVAASLFAVGVSYPFLRLRGAYFAVGTLALLLLLRIFDINLFQYTGGLVGIHVNLSGADLQRALFLGSLVFTVLALLVHYTIRRSRFGLGLRSIREEEEVSESFGVNAFRMKQISMIISAFFGGISGSLYAMYLGFINADNVLGVGAGLFPVVAAIAGGSGIFLGPLIGALFLVGVNQIAPLAIVALNPGAIVGPLVITGTLLILVGLFSPSGLVMIRFLQRNLSLREFDRILFRTFKRT